MFRKKTRARRGGIVSRFPTITVVCGNDDGALCVYDFTAAVADLLQVRLFVALTQPLCSPYTALIQPFHSPCVALI